MMSGLPLETVEPLKNFGIMNSITNLHLLWYFYRVIYDAWIHEYQIKLECLLPVNRMINLNALQASMETPHLLMIV